MSSPQQHIVTLLADGEFHSGQDVAERLQISRTSVCNAIAKIRASGLEVYSVRGRGYKMPQPLQLLDGGVIEAALRQHDINIKPEVFWQIDSTNSYLMANVAPAICLAETQTQGRGRRGRQWVSPPGGSIYLSISWQFQQTAITGLSLAAAVAVVRALNRTLGTDQFDLKWPNDILFQGNKLAGILLEMSGEVTGPSKVVVGVGINVKITPAAAEYIDQKWIDLDTIVKNKIDRNALVTELIYQLTRMFTQFSDQGLTPFVAEWRKRDCYLHEQVQLKVGGDIFSGISQGIDESGNLLINQAGKIRRFASGELRQVSNAT